MNEGWGVGGLDGSRFVPPPLFARAPPAPASHDSLFALPHILPSRGSPPSTCSPPRRKTRAGAGPGPEAVARASAATRHPPRTPRTPSFRCPRGSTPARPHINITFAPRAGRPYGGSPWHALSPGTDLNKPPATSRVSSDAASVEPWQPYRLFPTHQPPVAGPRPRLRLHRRQLEDPSCSSRGPTDRSASPSTGSGTPYSWTTLSWTPPRVPTIHFARREPTPTAANFPEKSPRAARASQDPPAKRAQSRSAPLPPRAAPRDYAAAVATAAATSDADAPAPPPPVITGEAHAILEPNVLYRRLSAETRFDLPRLDDAANARRDETHDASSALQRLALPPPATPRDVRAMVPWARETSAEVVPTRTPTKPRTRTATRGGRRRMEAPHPTDALSPASVASLGALQLRGPAKAVARAAAAAAGAGVTLARNPYETPEEDEDAERRRRRRRRRRRGI